MNVTQMCEQAELHTEDLEIYPEDAIPIINECILMDLGAKAGVQATEDVVIGTGDDWVQVSTSFLEIIEITKSGSRPPYYGKIYGSFFDGAFDYRDNYIRMPETGTFTVRGYVIPTPVTGADSEIPVHPLLHYPMCIYLASRMLFIDDEDSIPAQEKWREYQLYKSKALDQLNNIRPTTERPRVARAMRPWR